MVSWYAMASQAVDRALLECCCTGLAGSKPDESIAESMIYSKQLTCAFGSSVACYIDFPSIAMKTDCKPIK